MKVSSLKLISISLHGWTDNSLTPAGKYVGVVTEQGTKKRTLRETHVTVDK
jgi:hypothetical protein